VPGYRWTIKGTDQVPALLDPEKARALIDGIGGRALDRALSDLQREIVKKAPHGVSGNLAAGIQTERKGLSGRVFSGAKYGLPVEFGRKAKWPPVEPLVEWVRLSSGGQSFFQAVRAKWPDIDEEGAAFIIARSMSRRAREGKFFFKAGAEEARADVDRAFADALTEINEGLARA
jgi:hypothetical protein